MSKEVFKSLLSLKISLLHRAMEELPDSLRKPLEDLESQIMYALYELGGEYVHNAAGDSRKSELKHIDVK